MGAVGSLGRVFSAEHEVLNARSPRDREVPSFNGTRGRPEHELHNGSTRLTRQEIAVLVRVDGRLTLNEILRAVLPEAQSTFLDVFRSLRDRRLVSPPMPDAFALQWPAALEEPPSAADGAQADAGLKVLQRRGFYVQIAREGAGLRDPSARTSKAVVIDDDPMFARFTVTLLSLSGFQVHQAGDRASIVAALRKLPMPDVVLLDVQLPDFGRIGRSAQRACPRRAQARTGNHADWRSDTAGSSERNPCRCGRLHHQAGGAGRRCPGSADCSRSTAIGRRRQSLGPRAALLSGAARRSTG